MYKRLAPAMRGKHAMQYGVINNVINNVKTRSGIKKRFC